jgi:hypothetical protein
LQQAIAKFEGRAFSEDELRRRAEAFAPERFLHGFDEILTRALYDWRDRLPSGPIGYSSS